MRNSPKGWRYFAYGVAIAVAANFVAEGVRKLLRDAPNAEGE
ncbi:hypothetical protein W04_3335 [Pseudoalteromonas sp. SW0106-04]|nr:hypothetical protein [Pseudoalteromonas sp. SW0106-04]GAP76763.1 hypothetical protein W04_3335 [Pseudoalteromonas sp. SW0106-04]